LPARYWAWRFNPARLILLQGPTDDLAFAGWQVPNSACVTRFGKHLDSLGLAWAWASDDELALRAVQRMLHFKDPVGNRHEVYCGPQLASDRFVSPKVATGFVAGAEGFGHLVFSSADVPKTLDFVHQVLGLSDSDQIRVNIGPGVNFEVNFLHVNARHHSYAVAPRPPVPGPHKCIHHFMIEVNSVEEVGFARDRCLAMGQAVQMDIGQHPNDKMISFYGQTPSGFFVEFGCGGAKVDPQTWQVVTYDKLSEWGHRPNGEVALMAPVLPANVSVPPVSIAGEWNVVIKTPMGNNEVVFDLRVDGSDVHGAIKGPNEYNEIFDGKVDGNKLTWGSKLSSPIPMTLKFTASVDGDMITGGAKSPFGTAPFTGARAVTNVIGIASNSIGAVSNTHAASNRMRS
jgi:biphenyl-2,3-diol 1,2-dioxygenase